MDYIQLKINEIEYHVGSDVVPDTSLNNYIRNYANLRGTKAMCHEGGCGACIVTVKTNNRVTNKEEIFSVNSCLVAVLSCHNWHVTTIEGIGNQKIGYHPIQMRLATYNGSQCGYCSVGWVMSMYALYKNSNDKLTMSQIENSFGSNMCRCTGYRPILDAFKSFATDNPGRVISDIEDLISKPCSKTSLKCKKTERDSDDQSWCMVDLNNSNSCMIKGNNAISIDLHDGHKWYKVYELEEIFELLDNEGYDSYMLVAGNTGQGVYPIEKYPRILIDIRDVEKLREHELDVNLILGAGLSLTETMTIFQTLAASNDYFQYLSRLYSHLDLVAHIPVRNIGTIAGNLTLKHQHNEFQSDVFLLLETVGATMTILERNNEISEITLPEFLETNMIGKVILNLKLPPLSNDDVLRTFKIMPRNQNAHAQVNAGFLYKISQETKLVELATVVYGGISPEFIHAKQTEEFLIGKNIFDNVTVQLALNVLSEELFPNLDPPEPSPIFRKKLAIGLFYKGLLDMASPGEMSSRVKSGAEVFTTSRPLSHGSRSYETNRAVWPLNKPVAKLEAHIQCSGEAPFSNDLPTLPYEVYATFVLATVPTGDIVKFDPSEALKIDGVIAFYTAKDIPGRNTFTPLEVQYMVVEEELLCSGKVRFYGQPVGILVAKTEKLVNKAANLVKVMYSNVPERNPILTARQALQAPKEENRVFISDIIEPTNRGNDVVKVIKGKFDIFGQYHFTLEPQTCVVVPYEDELNVYTSCQWMEAAHLAIAKSLNMPENKINVLVRRLGGGYGSRVTRSSQIVAACALSARLLNKPCRFVLSVQTNMNALGKRLPCSCDYEVGVRKDGEIQYLQNEFYQDNGSSNNEPMIPLAEEGFKNCYDTKRWRIQGGSVVTDMPSNTWCRSPGHLEGIAMIENIMEHIATELKADPVSVRMANMQKEDNPLPELIEELKSTADYDKRDEAVKLFNRNNRWKKRAIRLVPIVWPLKYLSNFASLVSVYQADGTVTIIHGGIEMGQGINTKAAQVAAYILGVSLEKVTVKYSSNITTPNAFASGASRASDSVCYATMIACQIILKRLEPTRARLVNPTWEELVFAGHRDRVDLHASYMMSDRDPVKNYNVYGVTIAEVEVDIITGQHEVLRVDMLQDTGQSLSPEIDVGQIEGAFVMGLGYWTSENLIYNEKSGELLTNRTWNYHPPQAKDIPIDLRTHFRRSFINPAGVLGSKATGEPSICMAVVIMFAIRQCIGAARQDSGFPPDEWFNLKMPCTTENILLALETRLDELVL